ncbi:hypothetical protein [Parasphingorhabdus sp.]|uniref:hypothetical protein n=1 Tax=Parasphingorhabdus sp. TaxID=2709688 RepID=UPI003A93E560
MRKAAYVALALPLFAILVAPIWQPSAARKVAINGAQIRFCENQTERWVTYPAPNDQTFFHQELVLGEGSYSLAVIPNGRFRMNAFVYGGENSRYLGGNKNVSSYTHRFRVGDSFGEKFLIQLVKTSSTCDRCNVTMVLTAQNCPNRSSARKPTRPYCPVNQCMTGTGLFGIDKPRCISKPGARGGMCGSPGN